MKISRTFVTETIKIKDLFDQLLIRFANDKQPEDVVVENQYELSIKTTVGYKRIEAFRLVKPEAPVTLYLKNHKTLRGSPDHFVKTLNRS